MIEDILISLVSLLLGGAGTRWYLKRPLPFIEEDRNSGLKKYQAYKDAKIKASQDGS